MKMSRKGGMGLAEEFPPRMRLARARQRRYRRAGDGPFGQGLAALGANEFVQIPRGKHQQEPFANRLGALAPGTINLARRKFSELLRH
jgi:hypothetical protein